MAQETMQILDKCLVCGNPDHRLLYRATYTGGVDEAHRYFLAQRLGSAHGEIRRCDNCSFTFTSPQFDEAEYDSIYSRITNDAPAQAVVAGAGARATEKRYMRLRGLIAQHASFDVPFLDFGCGDGSFLHVVGSATGVGFEVGAPGVRAGPSGCKILCGRLLELAGTEALPWETQEFVTAFDVFEHLPSLVRDVSLLRRVIRPGGKLFVTVPDVSSPMARIAGRRWNMLLLEHLWYFSAATMDRFLLNAGFSSVGHSAVPYDASVGHVVKRLSESMGGRPFHLPAWLRDWVLPVPAGILFAAYRRID